MHSWGDKGVDWDGINQAAMYISDFCKTWGRLGGQAKEKYGTVRFYASFGWISLHSLIYPGYVYCQFPRWLWKLDTYGISKVLSLFERPFVAYQRFIYKKAYTNAVKKWPHLKEEITCAADHQDLLEHLTK